MIYILMEVRPRWSNQDLVFAYALMNINWRILIRVGSNLGRRLLVIH